MTNQTQDDGERKELSPEVMGCLDDFVKRDGKDLQYAKSVRINHFSFLPLDHLLAPKNIDKFKRLNIIWSDDAPSPLKEGKVDDYSCMSDEDLVELFSLAGRGYETNFFGKKRISDPYICFTHNGYRASNVYFTSKEQKKYFTFRDGRAYPYALYVARNEKAREELKAGLENIFEQLELFKGRALKEIGAKNDRYASGSVSSLFESIKQRTPAIWSHTLQPTCEKIVKRRYNLHQTVCATSGGETMEIGTIFYDLILPDRSVLTREMLADYHKQMAKYILLG